MALKNFLFLDDDENRHNGFNALEEALNGSTTLHVYTAADAIKALQTKPKFDCVFLDHDLDCTDPDSTGYVVAEFIALHLDRALVPKSVVVHSHNPVGTIRMLGVLDQAGIPAKSTVFGL